MAELAAREQTDEAQEEGNFKTPRQAFERNHLRSAIHGRTRVQSGRWKTLLTRSVTDIVTVIIVTVIIVTVAITLDHLGRCATVIP